ncbi:MAG: SH3 domain-containing protein [Deltaproteobacteria bacterium]|nr:SH3 domain-containing protein [Candidatus Zymogenaceae bacterium]
MKHVIVLVIVIVIGIAAAGHSSALERGAIVIGSRVQMHESAAGDSPAVGLLSEGAAVDILGRKPKPVDIEGFTDYWYLIGYRGKTGWVFGQFISPSTKATGLARIFTTAELIDYCDRAVRNLVDIRNAGFYDALIDGSGRFIADVGEMSQDPILSAYVKELEPYRLFATWSLSAGYAGTGDIKNAEKIKKQLQTYNPGALLPDGTTLGARINELDKMIQGKSETTQ